VEVPSDGTESDEYFVEKDEYKYFEFTLSEMADVDVYLDVLSGDADMYILKPSASMAKIPGEDSANHNFASAHGSGPEELFLHRDNFDESVDIGPTKFFKIGVHGWASHGSRFTLQVTAEPTPRTLDNEQNASLNAVFEKCCSESDACSKWKEFRDDGEDLCTTPMIRCNPDGTARSLRFLPNENYECVLRASDLEAFASSVTRMSMSEAGPNLSLSDGTISPLEMFMGWTELIDLELSDLDLSAMELSEVCDLNAGLMRFVASSSYIEGSIPSCLMNMPALKDLTLPDNYLEGTLPEIPSTSMLSAIDLGAQNSDESLHGTFPASWASSNTLEVIVLNHLELGGTLPDRFGTYGGNNDSKLRWLILMNNTFTGSIPSTLGTEEHMTILYLSGNGFTGAVPVGIYDHPTREDVMLHSNRLDTLAVESPESTPGANLWYFRGSQNAFDDESIPHAFTVMPKLQFLRLDQNRFSGNILPGDAEYTPTWNSLVFLDVHSNYFSGDLRDETAWGQVFNTPATSPYQYFDISYNAFTEIPAWLENYPDIAVYENADVYASGEQLKAGNNKISPFMGSIIAVASGGFSVFVGFMIYGMVAKRRRRAQDNRFGEFRTYPGVEMA
jgi:Leucine-rich repeat (LRR) protein